MAVSVTDPRMAFRAEYFELPSHITREYLCVFYHGDQSIELLETKTGKPFLKRTPSPNHHKSHFFLGAEVVVFGRVLKLTSYADKVTEQLCEKLSESVIAVVSEKVFPRIGDCLDIATQECGYGICNMQVVELRGADWDAPPGGLDAPAADLPASFKGQRVLVLQLVRDHAIEKAQGLAQRFGGPTWVAQDRRQVERAARLLQIANRRPAADLVGPSSVVLVKPHIVSAKRGGEALQAIFDAVPGLRLVCLSQVTLSTARSDAFFMPYKGVLRDYRAVVEHMASGACWAAQFVLDTELADDVVIAVREAVGPFDPSIAKVLRPKTLRARLGKDNSRNAVHCSDLLDDGPADAIFLWAPPAPPTV